MPDDIRSTILNLVAETAYPTQERWSGELDPDALADAKRRLGVKEPVEIDVRYPPMEDLAILMQSGMSRRGYFDNESLRDTGRHYIYVSSLLNADEANETILHELTHAAQIERYGFRDYRRTYEIDRMTVGYDENRFEQEAHRASDALAPHVRVVAE